MWLSAAFFVHLFCVTNLLLMIVVLDSASLANKQEAGVGEAQSNRHVRNSRQPTELIFVQEKKSRTRIHNALVILEVRCSIKMHCRV